MTQHPSPTDTDAFDGWPSWHYLLGFWALIVILVALTIVAVAGAAGFVYQTLQLG